MKPSVRPAEEDNRARWAAEDAAEAKERDVKALAVSMESNERELRRLEREREARERQYAAWDKLLALPNFAEYLIDRGLRVNDDARRAPRADEMERAALGAMMMLREEATTKGMRRLHVRHFPHVHDTPLLNGRIFSSITRLEKMRQANPASPLRSIDVLAVYEDMVRRSSPEQRKKERHLFAYLHACIESTPCSANIDYYIEKVIENSRKRHMFVLGEMLIEAAADPDCDGGRLQVIAHNAISAISAHGWCDLKAIFEREK